LCEHEKLGNWLWNTHTTIKSFEITPYQKPLKLVEPKILENQEINIVWNTRRKQG
jgi:hypothetical protein